MCVGGVWVSLGVPKGVLENIKAADTANTANTAIRHTLCVGFVCVCVDVTWCTQGGVGKYKSCGHGKHGYVPKHVASVHN